MTKLAWKPWHQVVTLREELRTGELSLSMFAADLYDVAMQARRRAVYEEPGQFFALTYPTINLRQLAKDVMLRLAGRSDKAVRQLERTYGGGKTHALITLYHLANDPDGLPKSRTVDEFVQDIDITPPRARVAVLAFDKLDVEKGMEVRSPDGQRRWLKHPWSVLAYEIAGSEGLKLLHAEGLDKERESAPAENLLATLLELPAREDLATLVLIDELLTYAREKAGLDPRWRATIINFFQYLTQAATRVDRAAVVASLLATDPQKSDSLGKELTQELYAIFRREHEEGVLPVEREDVAEVLRRRFFTPESIQDSAAFKADVVAALRGIADLDEQTKKDQRAAEERFLKSYPFHPDLTDVLYSKWTNLEVFQGTRGVLRTFAAALRDAERWDTCPLVAANVFLGPAETTSLSEAARELTTVATTEQYEGKRQEWAGILVGELAKARDVQNESRGLRFREIEQAVIATFLHSQPIGHKALLRDLFLLVGPTRPDRIELEKALRRWADISWFLDEAALQDADVGTDGQKLVPRSWRLGSKPNLRQMHHESRTRVEASPDVVDLKLIEEIGTVRSLTVGAGAAGASVHLLPERPRDIQDDGEFHFAILVPKAASDYARPSPEARRFIDEKTGPDDPRFFRNAIVLVVPSRDGLEAARSSVIDCLAWQDVESLLTGQDVDQVRREALNASLKAAEKQIPDAIRQAYAIVVTVSPNNQVESFRVPVSSEPLFNIVKADPRSRIQDTAVTAEAMLPGGPYDLWREGETAHPVKDLTEAFAQRPHLPKMLNRQAILDTIVQGCRDGTFVLRDRRPDQSYRTFWRADPDEPALQAPGLDAVLAEAATLTEIDPSLLVPNALPGLWTGEVITLRDVFEYFSGSRVVKVAYDEPVSIPRAERTAVEAAVTAAVRGGRLWLTAGPASILAEEIPTGLLTDDAELRPPPAPLSTAEILPEELPGAWSGEEATARAISDALAEKRGQPLPWATVRDVIDGAIRARHLERTPDSGPWPCDYAAAQSVKLRAIAVGTEPVAPRVRDVRFGAFAAEAELRPNEIQDIADVIGDIVKAAVGQELKFHLCVEVGGEQAPPQDVVDEINRILTDVREDLQLRRRL